MFVVLFVGLFVVLSVVSVVVLAFPIRSPDFFCRGKLEKAIFFRYVGFVCGRYAKVRGQ